jgi:glutamate racemase
MICRPLCYILFILTGCTGPVAREMRSQHAWQAPAIAHDILNNRQSAYFIDFQEYNQQERSQLPIGVFDSGTGGIAVLNSLLSLDDFHNDTGESGPDGIPDMVKEDFIYLADQANMPYGNYARENNTELLREHILKDVHFLMANHYETLTNQSVKKDQAKIIVVACNTATAYGLEDMKQFVRETNTGVKVIGVINAGARGALETFSRNESGAIAILATAGTVASDGYKKTLEALIASKEYQGTIQIYQQGGVGIAETLDEEKNFFDRSISRARPGYKGPSPVDPEYPIKRELMKIYNFDFSGNNMLCSSGNDCLNFQLNSVTNYVRYHLVSLMEQIRNTPNAQPLKTVILGCTHYPYVADTIRNILHELYNLKIDDGYVYRHIMSKQITLIDPAVNTAREVYEALRADHLLSVDTAPQQAAYFITVPNTQNPNVVTDSAGGFTYGYKYGRIPGSGEQFTKAIPFSDASISNDIYERLRLLTPYAYHLMNTPKNPNP